MSNLVSLIDFSLSAHSEMNKMYEENLEIFIWNSKVAVNEGRK